MNLAQLIDLDKLRGDDPLARKPAPLPPMGVVTRDPDRHVTDGQLRGIAEQDLAKKPSASSLVRAIIARHREGLALEAIALEVGDRYPISTLQLALQGQVQQKRLRREGTKGASRWFITALGRELLDQP